MITKITTTQTMDTMGEATHEDLHNWCEYLGQSLSEEYPNALVVVREIANNSPTTLHVETDGPDAYETSEVQEYINRLWDHWT